MTDAKFKNLDRTIHEGARLAIMSALAGAKEISFRELQDALELTDGNLGAHLKTLETAGHVAVRRAQESGRRGRPTSYVSLTAEGRRAFASYVALLEEILAPALSAKGAKKRGLGLAPS